MKLVVATVGRLKRGPERDLAERFHDRAVTAGRALGFRAIDLVELDESQARRAEERIAAEGVALAGHVPAAACAVALDRRGDNLTSETLAQRLAGWRDQGVPATVFLIGGADGLAEELCQRARLRLAFGAATWPHQLARIMLLEQLYRCMTILAGHPYHRA
jgi:23S rRNA (pseudouridine1915-N3)-methyltransferase